MSFKWDAILHNWERPTFTDAQTHDDKGQSSSKKVQKCPILILIPTSQNPFYIYQPKHDFFEILNGRSKIWPFKRVTEEPSWFWMIIESCEIVA